MMSGGNRSFCRSPVRRYFSRGDASVADDFKLDAARVARVLADEAGQPGGILPLDVRDHALRLIAKMDPQFFLFHVVRNPARRSIVPQPVGVSAVQSVR